jgi:hypothetical protein
VQPLYRHKINCLLLFVLLAARNTNAQPNLEQYDNRIVHFGFTLSINNASIRADAKTAFLPTDSLLNFKQVSFPGIGLGAITNFHLGKYFDIRLMFPIISFVQRNIIYEFPNRQKEVKIESAYCDASLLLKYKSARRKNTRAYVVGGFRMSYDFASSTKQKRSNQAPVVSLVPLTYGYEGGFGLDIYFPYFKFSPEIKVCNTFGNAMYSDGYIYTNALERLSPSMLMFSLHFE